ncbi:PAS domain-containing protein [Spirulina subsalsa]|uniref:PAS domain-containing protein n=1 Tax=Spirulina subsalsa TaxID=54311 RepID=UPI00031F7224|nr:PAS domain-containing protein [Spirulina subsalsa]
MVLFNTPDTTHSQELLQHIPGAIYELWQHPDGHFSLPYASEQLRGIYGVSSLGLETDATPFFSSINAEDHPRVLESLQESAQGLSLWHSTHRVDSAEGNSLWVVTYATPERQPDGSTKWSGYLQNITDLKTTQTSTEKRLHRIVESLNDMVFMIAPDGTLTFLSPLVENILGYPLEEILYTPFTSLLHPEDQPSSLAVFQGILAGEWVQHHEYRIRHADGRYYWHSANLSPFEDETGETSCLGVSSFIHPRKQAELARQESELRLHLALEASNTGLWDWNLQTNEVKFNANWRGMLGYEEHEIANDLKEWKNRIHPQDLQGVYEAINRHLTGEVDFYQNEQRLLCKNGSYKWILDQGRVVEWDEARKPLRFIGTHTDISQRKQDEIQLKQLTHQLKKAQEVGNWGHWIYDVVSQKITWSEQVFRMFNHPLEQGEPSFEEHIEQIHPDDRILFLERITAATQGVPQAFEYRVERPDGTVGYLDSRIELEFQDELVVRMFAVVMDITERVEMERANRENEEKLRSLFELSPVGIVLNNMQGQFIEANPAITEITGYTLEELNQLSYLDLTPAEYQSEEARHLKSLKILGQYGPYEKEYIHKQGHRVPVELNGMLITRQDGQQYIWSMIADISQRKEAEARKIQQVNQELKLLENILEVVLAGYWDWDIPNNQEYLSPRFKWMLGYEDHELANSPESWQQLIWSEDLPKVFQNFEAHVQSQGKVPFYNEVRYHHKNGSIIWVLCSGQVIEWDEENNPLRMIGCHIDITQQKQTELALIELSNQLKKAQEVAHLGYWSFDLASQKITWSEQVFRMFSQPLEQGEPSFEEYIEKVHPQDRAFVLERVSAANQGIPQSFDHRILNPDGTVRHVEARIELEFQDEQVVRMFGVLMDITERVEMERANRENEAKLRSLFELSPVGIVLNNMQGQFIEANPAITEITGYTLEELNQLSYWDLTPAEYGEDEARKLELLKTTGRYGPYEKEYIHKQGHRVPVELTGMLITGRDGQQYIWSMIADISQRKQAETAIKDSQLRLQLALESSNIGLWDWNLQTNEVLFDNQWKRLLGYTEHEFETHVSEWASRVHPEDLEAVNADMRQHLQKQTPIYDNQHRIRCQDNSYKWIGAKGRVVEWDGAGNPVRFIGTFSDISDRKQAELRLIELSQQLQKAQEVAHLGYWSFDLATQKITWSEEVFKIFSHPLEQGEPSFEEHLQQVYPEDRAYFLERVAAANQGIPQTFDFRTLRPDGTLRYINSRIELEFQDEQVVRMFGVVMDITERRVAELELERFFTIALDLLCIADLEGHFLRLNQAWENILGYPVGELEGRVFLEFVHPDDLAPTLAAISNLEEGETIIRFTNRYRTKSGSYRHIEWLSVPQGDLIYAAARDITERVEAQAQIESLLSRTQLLNALSHEIRQYLDLDQIIQRAVEVIFEEVGVDICAFTDYREKDGHPYVEIVAEKRHPEMLSWLGVYDAMEYPDYYEALRNNRIFTFNRKNLGEDYDQGIHEFCESMGVNLYLMVPIRTLENISCLEMGRIDASREWRPDELELLESLATQIAIALQQADLYQTAQQRTAELQSAYQELQETQVQLIQAEKMSSLGQLVAGIAHEINNPISFIYGNVKPLEDYAESLLDILERYQDIYPQPPEELSELLEELDLPFIREDLPKMLQSMKTGAARIRDIVKSLRTFSRLDEADLKDVDLHENIDSTVMILQNQFKGKAGKSDIEIIRNYGNLPLVQCYIGLLNQVFMNLLVNAVQAIEERRTLEGNPTYLGVITITTTLEESGAVCISFEDNGWGMSDKVKAKIFEPFFTTKPVGSGTGMGLPTSHQIVTKYHKGELICHSTLGEGTRFIVRF